MKYDTVCLFYVFVPVAVWAKEWVVGWWGGDVFHVKRKIMNAEVSPI